MLEIKLMIKALLFLKTFHQLSDFKFLRTFLVQQLYLYGDGRQLLNYKNHIYSGRQKYNPFLKKIRIFAAKYLSSQT
jgi:hypothetical protein